MRTAFALVAFAVVVSLFADTVAVAQEPAQPRPNIVFFLADDLGIADLGCYGATDIRTPNIDRLAREGVRFTQFYSNGPECTPTRAAFLTGRYQQRVGGLECAIGIGGVGRYDDAARLAARHQLGLPATEITISKLLKDAGYATAIFGKWHLGYEDHFTPNLHGFDQALYAQGGGMDYFHHVEDPPAYTPVLRFNGKPMQHTQYFTSLVAEMGQTWLEANKKDQPDKPFFLYLPFTGPHAPYQGPDDRLPTPLPADSDRWKQGSADPRVYAAMIESMDSAVGLILETLNRLDLSKQTIVIFSSDNGGTKSARPFPYHGFKGQTFEGGIRVPCIVRWPGVLKPGTESAHPAATFDLTASFAAAAGVKPPRPFDGIDILGHVARDAAPPARDLFWRQRRGDRTWKGVRSGASKYVSETVGDKVTEYMFDLSKDPAEKHDLVSQRPDEAAKLRAALDRWETEVKPVR